MAVFAYQAIDEQHGTVRGSVAADTPRLARDLLRARGLRVARMQERHAHTGSRKPIGRSRDRHQIAPFIRELSTLLAVGVPLLEALDSIIAQRRGRLRTNLLALRDAVAGGARLSDAMRQQPGLFDDLCVSITEVGEDAGTLEEAMEKLADFQERSRQFKDKLATALMYPAIVLVFALLISLFLMSVTVPSILQPLIEMNRPLPWPTRVVKGASDAILRWGWLLALLCGLVAGSLTVLLRTHRGRCVRDRLLLRLPVIGPLLCKQAVVRICVIMSALIGSGVVFVRALSIAHRATRNVVLKDALERCEQAITAGSDVSAALEYTHAFPPLVVQIFGVGQQSGRMEEMLARLGTDYDKDVATAAQRLAAMLEPLLIVLLALLVLLIAMATMLPVLEAGDVLH